MLRIQYEQKLNHALKSTQTSKQEVTVRGCKRIKNQCVGERNNSKVGFLEEAD